MDLSAVSNLTFVGQLLGTTGDEPDAECREVHSYNSSWRCDFVNSTSDCYVEQGYIQYVLFIYCTLGTTLIPLAVTILVLWLLFLFVSLAVAADNFFCPSLEVIAKVLHMSDNIAGVTLLAFGNGAPDVFSAISAVNNMKDGDVGMVFGALLGAGVFLTTVVFGAVTLVGPFRAMQRPFLRDIIFYIGTVFFTFYVCYDKTIKFFESLAYILTYVVYVVVVITGRVLYQKYFRPVPSPIIREVREDESTSDCENTITPNGSMDNLLAPKRPPPANGGGDERTPLLRNHHIDQVVSYRDDTTDRQPDYPDEPRTFCGDFLQAVSPIDIAEWRDTKDKYHLRRLYAVFKAPALLILKLTVPLVDYSLPGHNWSKLLGVLHCVITPVFCVFAASSDFALEQLAPGFPVCLLFLITGVILAVVVIFTSRRDIPPVYHSVFAFIGFFSAVMWIKNIANEIVNILQAAGVLFSISNTVLGLTFLAWGNSIADLISDVVLAKRGKPRAGMSACFGGPLFNTLLGIGIPFTLAAYKNGGLTGSIDITFTPIQIFLFIGLAFSLISSLVVIPLLGFILRRPYGIFLIILYAVFLTLALLIESSVIRWNM